MKFTLSWLYDHLDSKADVNVIINTLTNIGLEVESVQDKEQEFKAFTVAQVTNVKKHPDADRLKVCDVKTKNGNFQVVCGAHNVKTGMLGIFAPINTYISGTKLHLKKSKIRGIESCGMLVSEREMGISDEHEGIIEIDKSYQVGDSFAKIFGLDDPIIEINITPNRSDCLSVRGIARDLAAAGLGTLKEIKFEKIKGNFESNIKWKRNFNKNEDFLCPGVSGRLFKNINNIESPDWLKKKLKAIGLKPISVLVDITNYVTFDLGRPLHVYDADKVNGNLSMRLAKQNEECETLDEKKYYLNSDTVVIADDNILHGIGGIMGGLHSRCSLHTKNAFLEVALFDPISITKSGRKLNLQSDARYRFERGIDQTSIEWGVHKATELIQKYCGGEVSEITSDHLALDKKSKIDFHTQKIKTLGGIEIDEKHQIKILEKLGFVIKSNKNNILKIEVPSFRPDIEGEADIVEEILRIYGFDKIEPISISHDTNIKRNILSENLLPFYKTKRLIANRGYLETVSWSFMSLEHVNFLKDNQLIKIKNPISSDLNIMRPSIFPNLLNSINFNIAKLFDNGKMFEVGPIFIHDKNENQSMIASGINYGSKISSTWDQEKRLFDVYDVKSDIFYVLEQLNAPIDKLVHESCNSEFYHLGKSAQLRLGKNILANFGEINPIVLKKFDIKATVCGFEIFLDNLDQFQYKKSSTKKSFDNNPLQLVERDFAFVLPKDLRTIDLTNAIRKLDKRLIKQVVIFDIFEGGKLPENKKSIALKVILQPFEKTFTDKEIEKISNTIIALISKSFDGELRQ